jgi:NTE family protein
LYQRTEKIINYEAFSPVQFIPTDRPQEIPEEGIALCLSGGGYRAMLYHVGALWRLNDAAYLPRLRRVSSVSGGSITAGVLGLAWPRLQFDSRGVAQRFKEEVVRPIMRFASTTIDVWAFVRSVLGPGTANDQLAAAYSKHLFGQSTLQDLPDDSAGPRFVINASNLQSGALWRFSKPYMADYKVGQIKNPQIKLATAVAASSAFPPFLSPAILHFNAADYTHLDGTTLHRPPYTTRVFLTDGGVYDNLGLETAWKRYSTILVSDGGSKMMPEKIPSRDWARHIRRVVTLIDNQVRVRRKIQIIESYRVGAGQPGHRDGAYWSSWGDIREYGLPDALACPVNKTNRLASVPTRLSGIDATTQKQLINWGFASCDAAMRRFADPSLPAPNDFPYPDVGVG